MKNVEKETKEIVNSNKPIKLSRLEYEILKYFKDDGYPYIARDQTLDLLCIYESKPKKSHLVWCNQKGRCDAFPFIQKAFYFVKWEDEEPTLIQDILDNCEVIEDVD